MAEEIEFTDRYQALGIPYPDPATMCPAECEGTGWIPVRRSETDPTLKALWEAAHTAADAHKDEACDGWHFVVCPSCNGTGNRATV